MSDTAQHREVEGIELVTIPLADYVHLVRCKQRLMESQISHEQLLKPVQGSIEYNPEVATFLAMRFGVKPMKVILKECRRRFGKGMTPSQSAAYRYWQKLRNEAVKVG